MNDNLNTAENNTNFPITFEAIKNYIEVIGKVVIGFIAICYVIGLVVVNLHFSKFGVYSLSLFRLNYITAGVWSLIPIFIVVLIFISLVSIIFLLIPKSREYASTWFGISSPLKKEPVYDNVFFSVAFVIITIITIIQLYRLNLTHIDKTALTVTMITGTFLFIYIVIWVLLTTKDSHFFSKVGRSIILFLLCSFIFIIHTALFAQGLYGEIPSYLGGGKPTKAQLVIDEKSKLKEKLENLGVIFKSETTTVNVLIVLATEEDYILIIESKYQDKVVLKGLTIPKNMINAVLYEEAIIGFGGGGGFSTGGGGGF